MCYHNMIQHSGCGHIAESHTCPWTLCAAAQSRLLSSRDQNPFSPHAHAHSHSQTLSPPFSPPAVPKRSSTVSGKPKRRFLSFSRRSTSTSVSSSSSWRTASNPDSASEPRSSFSLGGAAEMGYSEYEMAAARCKGVDVARREMAQSEADGKEGMRVCKECERWIGEMRFMVRRWEKTGSVRGTGAFEEFLKERGAGRERELYCEWGIDGGRF